MIKGNYFNTVEYLDYLKKNFDAPTYSKDNRDETCKRPDVKLIFEYIDQLNIKAEESLLEIGCGLGRLLTFLCDRYQVVGSGVDVSKEAIRLAKERLPKIAQNIKLGTAENLPFADGTFDHVVCWAVFDLTEQGKSLAEMLRMLKAGGRLLLTGKNNLFMDDDEDALIAEIKSREKGIPNHYTDYNLLREAIQRNGGHVILEHFFLRRGDFMQGVHVTERPEKFIEYCVIIQKNTHVPPARLDIAGSHSQTWAQLHG